MHPTQQLAMLLLVAGISIAGIVWIVSRSRRPKANRERRRRLAINSAGRLGDAVIEDVVDGVIYYSYTVRGVYYTACQDVSAIREFLPDELERLIGPATLKYMSANPANSILVCEAWSGIRAPSKVRVHNA